MKLMDATTMSVIKSVIDSTFGIVVVGTLANNGVTLAPLHNLESLASARLLAKSNSSRLTSSPEPFL